MSFSRDVGLRRGAVIGGGELAPASGCLWLLASWLRAGTLPCWPRAEQKPVTSSVGSLCEWLCRYLDGSLAA